MARPRGFIENYRPQAKARQLIDDVQDVLSRIGRSITIRQVYYRLIAWHGYKKSEAFYRNQLIEVLGKARRAGQIAMASIVDGGAYLTGEWYFADVQEFVDYVQRIANDFQLDRQAGQQRRIMLWCEAQGVISQLEEYGRPYSAKVASKGGFDSVTAKHEAGQILAEEPLTVLHVGDLDPSGTHVYTALDEDVSAFAEAYGGDVEFVRIAVTAEQVEQYGLPTQPREFNRATGRLKDNRSFHHDFTVQLEAIDPADLRLIVREEIEARLDMHIYNEVLGREAEQREEVIRLAARLTE